MNILRNERPGDWSNIWETMLQGIDDVKKDKWWFWDDFLSSADEKIVTILMKARKKELGNNSIISAVRKNLL